MVCLTIDETTEVEDHTSGLFALAKQGCIGVLQLRKLLLITLTLSLKFLGDLLLKDKGLKGVITLSLRTRQAQGKPCCVIFVLINERRKSSVLALVGFDLDLEFLRFFCKLLSKGLKFEKLIKVSQSPCTH